MQQIRKFLDVRRLDYARAIATVRLLVKKKIGIPLSTEDKENLDFFDCLRVIDAHISQKNQSTMTLSLQGIYNNIAINLRTGPRNSDVAVFKQILGWEEYKPVVQAFKNHFHVDATTIIDAGGNIGLTALYFSTHFPDANIISVEPDSGNFNLLAANLNQQNVTCVQGAVWSRNCLLKLVNDFRDKRSWSCRVEETKEKTENTLPAYSIMHLKSQHNFNYIDILKMDIEGAEKEVFSGSNLDFLTYTKCIALEIHDEFNCRNDIYQCLSNKGFTHFNTGELTIGINKNFLS